MTPGLRSRDDHEIARVIVAVHEHLRLRQRFGDQELESASR